MFFTFACGNNVSAPLVVRVTYPVTPSSQRKKPGLPSCRQRRDRPIVFSKIQKNSFSLSKNDFFETSFLSIAHHSQSSPKLDTPQMRSPDCNPHQNSTCGARKIQNKKIEFSFIKMHRIKGTKTSIQQTPRSPTPHVRGVCSAFEQNFAENMASKKLYI